MRPLRPACVGLVLVLALLAGCAEPDDGYTGSVKSGVRVIHVHVGWNDERNGQYMQPAEILVRQGEKVRFVVTNDDDPGTDYNGDKPGMDHFHDVSLLDYDGTGDGRAEDIRHQAPPGETVRTSLDGKDHFIATTPGTFNLICEVRTVPPHAVLGMRASFVVEPREEAGNG